MLIERAEVAVNHNGEMLRYNYEMYPDHILLQCRLGTFNVPHVLGTTPSAYEIRQMVVTLVNEGELPSVTLRSN